MRMQRGCLHPRALLGGPCLPKVLLLKGLPTSTGNLRDISRVRDPPGAQRHEDANQKNCVMVLVPLLVGVVIVEPPTG